MRQFTKKELIQIKVFDKYINDRRKKGLEIIYHSEDGKEVILGSPQCLCKGGIK